VLPVASLDDPFLPLISTWMHVMQNVITVIYAERDSSKALSKAQILKHPKTSQSGILWVL